MFLSFLGVDFHVKVLTVKDVHAMFYFVHLISMAILDMRLTFYGRTENGSPDEGLGECPMDVRTMSRHWTSRRRILRFSTEDTAS